MNRTEFIKRIRDIIKEEQYKYDNLPENETFERATILGRINGLLKAWEIANSMEK